jgi:thiamine-phosphate pyrophosphorylase
MHKHIPNLFVFLDHYDKHLFKNNIKNIGVIYRNYNNSKNIKELMKITSECKKKRFPIFIANDSKLAIKVKANGIYIPAFNTKKQFKNLENRNFTLLGSAHNQKEIKEKILQKCEGIFLSPLFYVKKKKNYLNIHKFNLLANSNNAKFFALGGINEKNIIKLNLLNINGFAGISIFKKKTGLKRPVFSKNNLF